MSDQEEKKGRRSKDRRNNVTKKKKKWNWKGEIKKREDKTLKEKKENIWLRTEEGKQK